MKRTIEKHILLNREEAQDLQKKAKKVCLSEGALLRMLLRGYAPKEQPDERFYDAMRQLSAIGNNLNQLSAKANTLGFVDAVQLAKEKQLYPNKVYGWSDWLRFLTMRPTPKRQQSPNRNTLWQTIKR